MCSPRHRLCVREMLYLPLFVLLKLKVKSRGWKKDYTKLKRSNTYLAWNYDVLIMLVWHLSIWTKLLFWRFPSSSHSAFPTLSHTHTLSLPLFLNKMLQHSKSAHRKEIAFCQRFVFVFVFFSNFFLFLSLSLGFDKEVKKIQWKRITYKARNL